MRYDNPMGDELSPAQLTELESDLHDLKTSLEDLLIATETGANPVSLRENTGRLSRMDEMHNQSILLANRNVTRNRLKQVIAAIERIKQDDFGFCTNCDGVICLNRLKAYPEANLCLDCQSEHEKTDDT